MRWVSVTHSWVAHEGSQLRGHRQGLSARDRVRDDQVALRGMQRAGEKGVRAGHHLLDQQHGPLRELVRIRAGLLPHRDLLGEQILALDTNIKSK